jgi:hypothetical protein
LSSNRPYLVALRECLGSRQDHVNLLCLADSEASLQAILKWVGGWISRDTKPRSSGKRAPPKHQMRTSSKAIVIRNLPHTRNNKDASGRERLLLSTCFQVESPPHPHILLGFALFVTSLLASFILRYVILREPFLRAKK